MIKLFKKFKRYTRTGIAAGLLLSISPASAQSFGVDNAQSCEAVVCLYSRMHHGHLASKQLACRPSIHHFFSIRRYTFPIGFDPARTSKARSKWLLACRTGLTAPQNLPFYAEIIALYGGLLFDPGF